MKPLFSIPLLLLSLSIFGCPGSNPSDNTQDEPSLNGAVVDENHMPVTDAEIHYFFGHRYFTPKTDLATNPMPSTRIGFSIPESSRVTIKVLHLGTRKYLFTLMDTVMMSGNYQIRADAGNLTNGFYIYQITAASFQKEIVAAIVTYDISELIKKEPLTKTGADGKFSLPMSVLGVGRMLYITNATNSIAIDSTKIDSIAVFVHKQRKILIEGFNVNETQSITRTFVLK